MSLDDKIEGALKTLTNWVEYETIKIGLEDEYRLRLHLLRAISDEVLARDLEVRDGSESVINWVSAAASYRKAGKKAEAVRCYKRALEYLPEDESIKRELQLCVG